MLLHTLIDWMRTEEEEREVNHHGKTITVGGGKQNTDKEMVGLNGMLERNKGDFNSAPVLHDSPDSQWEHGSS